jgi:hypothetical protein
MLNITLSAPTTETDKTRGPVQVGWIRDIPKGEILYPEPKRVSIRPPQKDHPKSAARCPAVLQMEGRYFEIACPFDIHLGFGRDEQGRPHLINRMGAASPVRSNKLADLMVLVNEREWRFPDRPTVQMNLPYVFLSDEPVWITQLDAFMHYRKTPLPGTIFGGRFPIHAWPRHLMWAFEWHDTSKDLVLRRGEPLFYANFETMNPDRPVVVGEMEKTDELMDYIHSISGVVNYVNQTFSLFEEAEKIRPDTLVKMKGKSKCPIDHSKS